MESRKRIPPEIRAGIHGFNQVLVMIALESFLPFTWATFLYAVLATIVCTLFTTPALQNFMGRWGIPCPIAPVRPERALRYRVGETMIPRFSASDSRTEVS